jgi:hypothetical protein
MMAAAAATLPKRVGEWRLKLALSSPGAFESCVVALSLLAGGCYALAGRVRTSALIYVDVAVLQLQLGDVEGARK